MIQRKKVIPQAQGLTLEIGIGSGLNLSFYDKNRVSKIVGIDPTPHKKALTDAISECSIPTEFIQTSAVSLEMENDTFDTIVSTYTFCTIPELEKCLLEMKRVLKPSGKLIFCEHGKAPDVDVLKKQNRINPIWKRISGGCNLNRDIPEYLSSNGFKIHNLETMYLPGWKPATFNFWGYAQTQ